MDYQKFNIFLKELMEINLQDLPIEEYRKIRENFYNNINELTDILKTLEGKPTGMIHDICAEFLRKDSIMLSQLLEPLFILFETGELPYFYTYYRGCNILKSDFRNSKYLFDEQTKKYYPVFDVKQINDMIQEIIQHGFDNDGLDKYGIYGKGHYDYLVNFRKEHSDKLIDPRDREGDYLKKSNLLKQIEKLSNLESPTPVQLAILKRKKGYLKNNPIHFLDDINPNWEKKPFDSGYARLYKLHDDLKRHDFRYSFQSEYETSYLSLFYIFLLECKSVLSGRWTKEDYQELMLLGEKAFNSKDLVNMDKFIGKIHAYLDNIK